MKKYELTNEVKTVRNVVLHRIRALRDFGSVKAGMLGGWIEKEENLSHNGNAWVYDDAEVYGEAKVYDDAKVYDAAKVYGKARVYDKAEVYDDAEVYGEAWVFDSAEVYGDAKVYGSAQVYGNALVFGDAWVFDNTFVFDNAFISGSAQVYGYAVVCGNALVSGATKIYGDAQIFGGKWKKSPLYIQGTKWTFNVASNEEVRVGCHVHTWEWWHKQFRAIARVNHEENIIGEYVQYFNLACRLYGHEDCLIKLEECAE